MNSIKSLYKSFNILNVTILCIFILLLGSIGDFIVSGTIVSADMRVNTLLFAFRNFLAVKTFIWITLLGKSPTIIVFTLAISTLWWLSQKKWQIVGLWVSIAGSEGLTFFTKLLFHRPRPANAVFLENSNSFPSGHATIAVAFYGFLAYLLIRKIKNKLYKLLVILTTLILILAIGFSRLYLGVHYVSDVWTGYLVGLLWLLIGISITEWKSSQKHNASQKIIPKYLSTIALGLATTALIFYIAYGFLYHPKFLPKSLNTTGATISKIT